MGVAEPTGEVFVVMVEAGGCHMFISGCLQWTTAVSVAWQWSVWRGTVSEDGTSGIGTSIVGLFGLQRIVVGRSVGLGYSMRQIVGRWHKRLLWLTNIAAEVLCVGEARR